MNEWTTSQEKQPRTQRIMAQLSLLEWKSSELLFLSCCLWAPSSTKQWINKQKLLDNSCYLRRFFWNNQVGDNKSSAVHTLEGRLPPSLNEIQTHHPLPLERISPHPDLYIILGSLTLLIIMLPLRGELSSLNFWYKCKHWHKHRCVLSFIEWFIFPHKNRRRLKLPKVFT